MNAAYFVLVDPATKFMFTFKGERTELTSNVDEAICFHDAKSADLYRKHNTGLANYIIQGM